MITVDGILLGKMEAYSIYNHELYCHLSSTF